jgi:hypothetical protein
MVDVIAKLKAWRTANALSQRQAQRQLLICHEGDALSGVVPRVGEIAAELVFYCSAASSRTGPCITTTAARPRLKNSTPIGNDAPRNVLALTTSLRTMCGETEARAASTVSLKDPMMCPKFELEIGCSPCSVCFLFFLRGRKGADDSIHRGEK